MFELILAVLAVVAGSALCSMTEAALFSVSLVRVEERAQQIGGAARILLRIRRNMERPIATIVVLNNIANIVGSIMVGAFAADLLGDRWLGLFSAGLTMAVILFAEIVPKTVGERYCMAISLAAARPVQALTTLFLPVVWLISFLTRPITRGVRAPSTTESEIQLLARIGREEGIIEHDESEMIQRIFRLNDVTAAHIMTPRVKLTYAYGKQTIEDARSIFLDSPHTRILVVGDNVDDVRGVVRKEAALRALLEGRGADEIFAITGKTLFVPGAARADALLETFRNTRQHLAVAVDEFGGVLGVVSLEDVLEVITGEIVDETDLVADLQEEARRNRRGNVSRYAEP